MVSSFKIRCPNCTEVTECHAKTHDEAAREAKKKCENCACPSRELH